MKRFRIQIEADDASGFRGFKDGFAVTTEAQRAIDEEASTLRGEEFNRFLKQHGAMGRAFAPQRRSHHHRPVISFKELLTRES